MMKIIKSKSPAKVRVVSSGDDVLYSGIMLDGEAIDAVVDCANNILQNVGHKPMFTYGLMHTTFNFYGRKNPFTTDIPHIDKIDMHKRVSFACNKLGVYYAPNDADEFVIKNIGLLVDTSSVRLLNEYSNAYHDFTKMFRKHPHITVAIDETSAAKYTDRCFAGTLESPEFNSVSDLRPLLSGYISDALVLTGTLEYVNTRHQIIDRFVEASALSYEERGKQTINVLLDYGLDDTTLLYMHRIRDTLNHNEVRTISNLGYFIKNNPEKIMLTDGIGVTRYARIVSAYNAYMDTDFSTEYKEGI